MRISARHRVAIAAAILSIFAPRAGAQVAPIVQVLHGFSGNGTSSTGDGARPLGALVQDGAGNFYGTTQYNGSKGFGTVFMMTPQGVITILHDFANKGTDGAYPQAGLILGSGGNLYGTTSFGPGESNGTVFQITPDGMLTTLHVFTGAESDGATCGAALVQDGAGNLFGTTEAGGSHGTGTVFKIDNSGTYTTLYSFTAVDQNGMNSDGASPYAALVPDGSGNYFGTTHSGGTASAGTIFSVTPKGVLTSLYSFTGSGTDGAYPYAALVPGGDGNFYGTTYGGGANGEGTVFQFVPDSAAPTTLASFSAVDGQSRNTDGANPFAGLTPDGAGLFYGVTTAGGAGATGTIFTVTTAGSPETLYSFGALDGNFENADGARPEAGLLLGGDGNFYGAAASAGPNGNGTIFELNLSGAPTVTAAVTTPDAHVSGDTSAVITLTLSAAQNVDVHVAYKIGGTAVNGTDYMLLTGSKKIKAGKTSKPLQIRPLGNLGGAASKGVTITLQPGDGYTVGTTDKLKAKILNP